ncbi:MAG: sigma 54-interacting transcriptional regulator [Sedimentibacter sp.]
MNGKIVFVVPDEKLANKAREVIDEQKEDIEVYIGSFSEGLRHARHAVREGANIIISRGGTGNLIKRNVEIPVVNIEFGSYDVINSVYKAIEYSNNIGVVGFSGMSLTYKKVSPILERTFSAKINTSTIKTEREIEQHVYNLYMMGCRVFIGGQAVMDVLDKHGYEGVLIETGKEAISEAISYAKGLMEVQLAEKEKSAILKSIIDFAYDGILGIDMQGLITVFNPVVQKITGVPYENAIKKSVDDVVENTRMLQVLKSGVPELGEIQQIGNTSIVTNRVPIVVDGEVFGVVATFQEIEKIQKMETQIRKKLLAKGHVAKSTFEDIKGKSKEILRTKDKARLYAGVDSTVLIMGETGTGKELFAQSIHNSSLRADKPFVAVNCAALPENLLESELFGYVEGAFTGARKGGKMGLFELAHGGTIFLDEISEMSPNLQARFLRVLQEKEVVRLGDDRIIPIDVRVIAATNRDLYKEVEEGGFREDLFYRLCVLKLDIPPLRNRKDDLYELVSYFLFEKNKMLNRKIKGITSASIAKIVLYDWPGNVRQLENFIERCVVLSEGKEIDIDIIDEAATGVPTYINEEENLTHENKINSKGVLRHIENETIKNVLEETNGNKSLAAEKLGISVTTLWRRLKNIEEQEKEK